MAYTTINKSTDNFNTLLYTGTGVARTVTSVGFEPDFFWIKQRSGTQGHLLWDTIRGGNYYLSCSSTAAQNNDVGTFTGASDGYTFNTDGAYNGNSSTYVGWNWKANGAGSANTDGSISSTVSANTTSGFSIVKWTGNGSNPSTVGHGLGAVPKMIITKRISGDTASWHCYHAGIGNAHDIYLNGANAKASDTSWNSTTPTSSVFTVNGANVNVSGAPYIAYVFANVTGYSKFGSYTGNGNADGAFIYTGFKPAFVMVKNSSATSTNWTICDSKRDGFNDNNHRLFPNIGDAESAASPWEMYSNGFKMTTTGSYVNSSGDNFIYMAFAEAPLVGSNNIPCTAR